MPEEPAKRMRDREPPGISQTITPTRATKAASFARVSLFGARHKFFDLARVSVKSAAHMHFMDPSKTARARKTTSRPRVTAGVPKGGEFTSRNRAEDALSLTTAATGTAHTPLAPEAALRFAERLVEGKSALFHMHDDSARDDITQNAVLSALTSASNNGADGLTEGLIANAVSRAMTAAISEQIGMRRPEDVKALRMLETQVEVFIHEQDRELTMRERNGLARQLQDNWPDPRRRPLAGYQARVIQEARHEPLHAHRETGGVDPAEVFDDGEDLRHLIEMVEDGSLTKEMARLRLWNAVARQEGAPLINRRLPADTDAAQNIRAVFAAGGPLAIAQRFILTEELTPEVDALLYPFDIRLSRDALDIARLLVSRGSAGEVLWQAATLAAADRSMMSR